MANRLSYFPNIHLYDEASGYEAGLFEDIAFKVDSVSTIRNRSFPDELDRLWLVGYYGVGTAGGGLLYRDSSDTTSADNGGTIFVDTDGTRWKRQHDGVVNVTWFGASPDQSDPTPNINNAIEYVASIGGGTVFFQRGTYYIYYQEDYSGTVEGDHSYGINAISAENIRLIGEGPYITILKLGDNQNIPIIDCSEAHNIAISGFTIDGNKSNQTDVVGLHCIRSTPSLNNSFMSDLRLINAAANGIGIQGGGPNGFNTIRDCLIENVGHDGIDFKNDVGGCTGNVVENVHVKGHNAAMESENAGIDIRGPANMVRDCYVEEYDSASGIRIQMGGTHDAEGVKWSSIIGCFTQPLSDHTDNPGTTYGFDIEYHNVLVSNCIDVGSTIGFSMLQREIQVNNCHSMNADVNGFVVSYPGGLDTNPERCMLSSCMARGSGNYGFRIAHQETKMSNCVARDCGTTGTTIEDGAKRSIIVGGQMKEGIEVNEPVGTIIQSVDSVKTENSFFESFDITTTGNKTVSLEHKLTYTPNTMDVSLSIQSNYNDWAYDMLHIQSVDSTYVNAVIHVSQASSYSGADANLIGKGSVYRYA